MIPQEKLDSLNAEQEELKIKIYDPKCMSDRRLYGKISRRYKELEAILATHDEVVEIMQGISDSKEMLTEEKDKEMQDLIKMEIEELEESLETKTDDLKELLAPKDPNDEKDAIIEIRAGAGGEEAGLFVADLYRMYSYYAERMKWKLEVLTAHQSGKGGYKEVSFMLRGNNVFGTMRFESGVHRVQRVPETEASGRIHTSAISVAVLPEADEVDIDISPNDLKIDVYRASGNGGQSVNTTDSAVRITHLPTGVVVTCQDEKSQLKNKDKAMKVLCSRLLDHEIAKQEAKISAQRRAQVGTGDRSAKIRTYNFPQSRVTDHRINLTSYRLNGILVGEIDEFIDALKVAYKNEKINN
ncbi:MAG: peptide chain release factor 1 [Candidatus Cloacimonetes bacterium 4572_65]|nr:MAG: peptide chain release factor 1 [Candidatus Cloacimonetes bacterium 4572_65]